MAKKKNEVVDPCAECRSIGVDTICDDNCSHKKASEKKTTSKKTTSKKREVPKVIRYLCSFKSHDGITLQSDVIIADNEDEAKDKFCRRFAGCSSAFAILYMLPSLHDELLSCVVVEDLSSAEDGFLKRMKEIKNSLLKILSSGKPDKKKFEELRDLYNTLWREISSASYTSKALRRECNVVSALFKTTCDFIQEN